MKITIGDIFLSLLAILWLIWTVYAMTIFIKYRVNVKAEKQIQATLLEGFWWLLNVIAPIIILIFWLAVKIANCIYNNWHKTI